MSRKCQRAKLILTDEQKDSLLKMSQSRTLPLQEVQRSKILLKYVDGIGLSAISKELTTTRVTVYKCIDKALSMGVEAALKDTFHRPFDPTITEEAKSWVISLACTKPKEHGYAAEFWSRNSLAQHVRNYSVKNGYPCLQKAAKATIQRILSSHPIRPDKIAYYCHSRDPDFDNKMKEVLMAYKEVSMLQGNSENSQQVVTVSVDEKPGVQALDNLADDIMPNPEKNSRILRDHQYKRMGTVSILASLDLQDGHVIAQVHDRHRSKEFICLLDELDRYYPKECQIRVILDNHSAHISKETRAYLATKPNRFIYVHTPTHGSWLNLVETLFGKMARTFLKGIRVKTLEELKERILLGIKEMNSAPVVFRWKKFDVVAKY